LAITITGGLPRLMAGDAVLQLLPSCYLSTCSRLSSSYCRDAFCQLVQDRLPAIAQLLSANLFKTVLQLLPSCFLSACSRLFSSYRRAAICQLVQDYPPAPAQLLSDNLVRTLLQLLLSCYLPTFSRLFSSYCPACSRLSSSY
jgi:hypothetical protein